MEICSDAKTRDCALIVATLTSFLPPFIVSSINIALPAIGAEFSMNAVLLGWIATSYLLSAPVFIPSMSAKLTAMIHNQFTKWAYWSILLNCSFNNGD
ncbi:MAG: hypothetical protein STSR0009_30330 [Methanoregula sp.]